MNASLPSVLPLSVSDVLALAPASGPVTGVARVPGSKSITNRALVLAALSNGQVKIANALFADDTARMMNGLTALGFSVTADETTQTITVQGRNGDVPAPRGDLFVGNSGTTARFITPLAVLGNGEFILDGVARMRERPMGDLIRALRQLGANVESVGANGCPPLRIHANGLKGGVCTVRADASSQFLSGLLMATPCADGPETRLVLEGPILSAPYISMTVAMMRDFGATVEVSDDGREYGIPGRQNYAAPNAGYAVEPDASAASYFFAAAAITNGRVQINGVGENPLQGDWAFVDILKQMGCRVVREKGSVTVEGTGNLRGVTVDMNAVSDTVMTLAAVAPFADGPTIIENVAHIRHKETDRLTAVAAELSRLGVRVDERADGLTIWPIQAAQWTPDTVLTYDDHRMAMAFALIGLRVPGIKIADPACVGKTFPDYFARLNDLVAGRNAAE